MLSVVFHFVRWYYHCEIPWRVPIEGVYFCHSGFGVIINGNVKIGRGTVIQHRVTLGQTDKGYPTIGENCYIGAGAIVVGNVNVGNNVKIGAGAVVITDIPDNSTAVGIPAKVVKTT